MHRSPFQKKFISWPYDRQIFLSSSKVLPFLSGFKIQIFRMSRGFCFQEFCILSMMRFRKSEKMNSSIQVANWFVGTHYWSITILRYHGRLVHIHHAKKQNLKWGEHTTAHTIWQHSFDEKAQKTYREEKATTIVCVNVVNVVWCGQMWQMDKCVTIWRFDWNSLSEAEKFLCV